VKKGDAIAMLDDEQLRIKKSQLQGNIQQGMLQLIQINAQIITLDTQMKAESLVSVNLSRKN
jgi:HlyD family secretion protein